MTHSTPLVQRVQIGPLNSLNIFSREAVYNDSRYFLLVQVNERLLFFTSAGLKDGKHHLTIFKSRSWPFARRQRSSDEKVISKPSLCNGILSR